LGMALSPIPAFVMDRFDLTNRPPWNMYRVKP